MYKRVLLAYDGSVEGRTALREGALLARQCGAEVFLLSIVTDPNAVLFAAAAQVGAYLPIEDDFTEVLNEGVARLKQLGFDPVAKLVRGEPAEEIGNFVLGPILSSWAIADRALLTAGGRVRRGRISWTIPIAVCWLAAMSSVTKS